METIQMTSLGMQNFGELKLGDVRRTDCLVGCVDEMSRHPGGTLPTKISRPSQLRSFYRLMKCKKVTHQTLMTAHCQATRRTMETIGTAQPDSVILLLHDATELDYTNREYLRNSLGQIGQGTNFGYICHNSLAVRFEPREVLGLSSQILHHRADVPEKETGKQLRERESRESRLWCLGAKACGPAPEGVFCVDISDSLSDTFEYMAYEISAQRHFVLRARENRKLVHPRGKSSYLFDVIRAERSVGSAEVAVSANTNQVARKAHVLFSYANVLIAPPGKKSGEYANTPLAVSVVRIWEPRAPKGVKPMEWILLTNVSVNNADQALERIEWYKCRPIVEEFHKAKKTGCGIESMRFETTDRLEPAIAIVSVVATTLLRLRDAARHPEADQTPATEIVDRVYVEALMAYDPKRVPSTCTIKQFLIYVARLGGHQNRKADGMPGWLTLWRGWMKLQHIVTGFELGRAKSRKRCGQE